MFRSRKKSSGRRQDEARDRDNSGILDRYSDTQDQPPPPLPPRSESHPGPRNIQYLKLTDGFNIVLASDTAVSPAPSKPSRQQGAKGEEGGGVGSETGQTSPAGGAKAAVTAENTQAKWRAEHETDKDAMCLHNAEARSAGPATSVASPSSPTPSHHGDNSPASPGRHEAMGSCSGSLEGNKCVQTTKSHPAARKTVSPVLTNRLKSRAVFVVEAAATSPTHVARPNSNARESAGEGARPDGTSTHGTGRRTGGEMRGEETSVDNHKRACVESGRVVSAPSDRCHQFVFSPHEQETDTNGPQSNTYLNINSPRVDECVARVSTLSTKAIDDQEPNKAAETGVITATSSDDYCEQKPHGTATVFHPHEQKRESLENTAERSNISQCSTDLKHFHSGNSDPATTPVPHDGANVIPRAEINKSSSFRGNGSKDKDSGRDSDTEARQIPANMFGRFSKHSLNSKKDLNETPAVYRKLDDTVNQNVLDTHTPGNDVSTTHSKVEEIASTLSEPGVDQTQLSEDAHTEESHHQPVPEVSPQTYSTPPKSRRRKMNHELDNMTIDQAVTRIADNNNSEDDGLDSDNMSPGSSLDRLSTHGSRDSFQSSDVQATGVSGLHAEAAVLEDTVEENEAAEDSSETSPVWQPRRRAGEYVNVEFRLPSDGQPTEYDNISMASGTMVIMGTDSGDSPDQHRRFNTELSSHDNLTYTSTSEDEEKHASVLSEEQPYEEVYRAGSDGPQQREKALKMRHGLVTAVLDSEKSYLGILEVLLQYKRNLEATCRTSQPVISEEDIVSIFSNLQDLHTIHKDFVDGLQHKVDHWAPEQTVGEVFSGLMEKFPEFGLYAEKYQTAAATIHRCSQESPKFQDIAQQIVLTSTTREETSLEEALFKPVQRLQRNTLVLHDLMKHTPKDHPDYPTLQNALHLSQHNLENFGTNLVPRNKVELTGTLVKSSFLVESVGNSRKLRFVFVFSDLLVCTKREHQQRGEEVTFSCKWFIPMEELKLDTKFSYQDDIKYSKKDEIEDVKKKLRNAKMEVRKELKKEESKSTQPISNLVPSRNVEKLQRRANELEAALILASPRLPFKVWHDTGKVHTLLMTTDYEREEWRELLTSLQDQGQSEGTDTPATLPSVFDVQEMVNSVRGLPEVSDIGSALIDTEEETIYGTLSITVHKLTGLTEPCDTYCCLEMDSYGHFFMKARTHISSNTTEPSWNEDFEVELEGSQTLRILCYRKEANKKGDTLLGRAAMEMSKDWLEGTFQEKTVAMNEYWLVLSICYMGTEKTLRRTPARLSGTAVFGVQIGMSARREGKTVPTIITACVQEVEKRGMEETGVYRVSGVTSDVQKLKKLFDKNVKVAVSQLSEVDIHSVTGLLKLYLRELSDPVFTEAAYPNFINALKLGDREDKERRMLSLFYQLPDINYYTAVYLLEHLLRISRNEAENKMGIHNLSTIFGPTLLAPAAKNTGISVTEMMSQGAEDCMRQSETIYFYLNLLASGGSLRRSSAQT